MLGAIFRLRQLCHDDEGLLGNIKKLCNPLMRRGKVTERLHKITRGEGGIHQKIALDFKGGQFGSTLP